jgi:hypothetical protein
MLHLIGLQATLGLMCNTATPSATPFLLQLLHFTERLVKCNNNT